MKVLSCITSFMDWVLLKLPMEFIKESLKMGLKMAKANIHGKMDHSTKATIAKIKEMEKDFLNPKKEVLKVNGKMIKFRAQVT